MNSGNNTMSNNISSAVAQSTTVTAGAGGAFSFVTDYSSQLSLALTFVALIVAIVFHVINKNIQKGRLDIEREKLEFEKIKFETEQKKGTSDDAPVECDVTSKKEDPIL